MENKKGREKGVTLIALIITVIVMLILAGVSISILTNDNGTFEKIDYATKVQKKQSIIETIEMAEMQVKMDNVFDKTKVPNIGTLIAKVKEISSINNNDYIISVDDVEQTATIIDKKTGVVVDISIDNKGNVLIESSIVEDISDIVKPTIEYTIDPAEGNYAESVKITVTVKEEKNGITKLQLPDNSEKTYSNQKTVVEEYTVTENGRYKFTAQGENGRIASKYIEIKNTLTVADISMDVENSEPTNESVNILLEYDNVGGQVLSNDNRFQYSIGENNWQTATANQAVTVMANSTVYARYFDGQNGYKTKTIQVTNIDIVKPNEFNLSETHTSNSITVSGSTEDTGSAGCATENIGISGYQFKLMDSEGTIIVDWTAKQTQTSYTFNENIIPGTYKVSMRAVDKAGNIQEATNKGFSVILGILNVKKTDGSWNSEENVNSPRLTAGMTPIYFSSNGTPIKLTASSSDAEWDKWYDYTAQTSTTATAGSGTSHWANAQTKDGSYWVWIPRYAYQIKSGLHYSDQGEIDVVFIDVYNKDHKNVAKTYSETYPTTTGSGTAAGRMNDFVVHPAFKWGNENLPGIWVAKFEASMSDAGATAAVMGSSNIIKIQPNVTSWRSISASDIFTKCKNMSAKSNPYGFTDVNAPHMMKNVELGAAVYLAQSKYGRNRTEITINNSSGYITGSAGNTVTAAADVGTTIWTTAAGQLASTTGNIYGIYDLSGGTSEYTAAFVDNRNVGTNNIGTDPYKTYNQSLLNELKSNANTPYLDVYSVGASNTDTPEANYVANSRKFGDAVYETSSNASGAMSWNVDYSGFPSLIYPVFYRGVRYSYGTDAGAFAFYPHTGDGHQVLGFRPVCFGG